MPIVTRTLLDGSGSLSPTDPTLVNDHGDMILNRGVMLRSDHFLRRPHLWPHGHVMSTTAALWSCDDSAPRTGSATHRKSLPHSSASLFLFYFFSFFHFLLYSFIPYHMHCLFLFIYLFVIYLLYSSMLPLFYVILLICINSGERLRHSPVSK